MRLVVHTSDGKVLNFDMESAGMMRMEMGIATTLPNKWWTLTDGSGNRHSVQTCHIVRISEEA